MQTPGTGYFFPDFQGDVVPVGPLLRSLLQETHESFLDLQDNCATEKNDYTRRIQWLEGLDQIRHKLMRFGVALSFKEKHFSRLKKLQEMHKIISKSEENVHVALHGFTNIEREFHNWCEPAWDVESAFHVLSTGSYRLLPTIITEQCGFQKEFDEKKEEEVMEELNRQLRYKLLTSTLPSGLKLEKIAVGMVELEFPGEYNVELSLRMGPQRKPPISDHERINWSLFELKILVQANKMSQELEDQRKGQQVVSQSQTNQLKLFVNAKMKHVRSSETLNCMHEILHEFCLKSILGVIQKQTSLLETEMGGSVQVLRDRKNGYVIVELWNEEKIELEFGEKRKSNSKHLRSEFRLEKETKRLLIIHFPQVSALKDPAICHRFSLKRTSIDLVELMRNLMIFHSNLKIADLVENLHPDTWWPLLTIKSEDSDQRIVAEPMTDWKNFIRGENVHSLEVCFFDNYSLQVFINRRTGKISLQQTSIQKQHLNYASDLINEDLKNFEKALTLIRSRCIIQRISQLAELSDFTSFCAPPFPEHVFRNEHVCFIRGQEFPFDFKILLLNPKEDSIQCFTQPNKFNSKPEEFAPAKKFLKKIQLTNNSPMISRNSIKKIMNIKTKIDFRQILKEKLEELEEKYEIKKSEVHVGGVVLFIQKLPAVQFILPKINPLPRLPNLCPIRVDVKANSICYSVELTKPNSLKHLLEFAKQIQILKPILSLFKKNKAIDGFLLTKIQCFPLYFICENSYTRVNIYMNPISIELFTNNKHTVIPSIPFLVKEFEENPSSLQSVLRKLVMLQTVFCTWDHVSTSFYKKLKEWRPGTEITKFCSAMPTSSENTIFSQTGLPQIQFQLLFSYPNSFTILWHDVLRTFSKKITKKDLGDVFFRLVVNGPVGLRIDPIYKQAFDNYKRFKQNKINLTWLNLFDGEKDQPPKLMFKETVGDEIQHLLTRYYDNIVCVPICKANTAFFASLLSLINYFLYHNKMGRFEEFASELFWISVIKATVHEIKKSYIKEERRLLIDQFNMNELLVHHVNEVTVAQPGGKSVAVKEHVLMFVVDILEIEKNQETKSVQGYKHWQCNKVIDSVTLRLCFNITTKDPKKRFGLWEKDKRRKRKYHIQTLQLKEINEQYSKLTRGNRTLIEMLNLVKKMPFEDIKRKFRFGVWKTVTGTRK